MLSLQRTFETLNSQKGNVELLCNQFAVVVETVPVELQLELIELQCSRSLKAKYDAVGLIQFIRSIPEKMCQLRLHIA